MPEEIDIRCCCRPCWNLNKIKREAENIAGQLTGGNEDEPATWVPVCDAHLESWWDEVEEGDELPAFNINEGSIYA